MSGLFLLSKAQMAEQVGLSENPVRTHLAAARTKLGVRNLYLMPFQTFAAPEPEVAAFRDVIFPHLRAAGLR